MWGKNRSKEPEVVCSLVKEPTVFIEDKARRKVELLMKEYPHQEWLAYLVGDEEEDKMFVHDISVPPHAYAQGACAEAEPFNVPKNCLGVIHSHHAMGAFHSGTDQDYVDKNYPVSVTVARNKDNVLSFDADSWRQTPCGRFLTVSCRVKYVQPKPPFNVDKFLTEAKANINRGVRLNTWPTREKVQYMVGGGFHMEDIVDRRGKPLPKEVVEDILANSSEVKGKPII
jgi:hypothetical protein